MAKITHLKTGKIKHITSGESFRITSNNILTLKKSPNQFAWSTRDLYYKNATVQEIITDLDDNYDAKIQLKDAGLLNCVYTGSFHKASIQKVLNTLATTFEVDIVKENGVFVVSGKGNCMK